MGAGFAAAEAVFQRHYEARCGTRSHPYPRVVEALIDASEYDELVLRRDKP